MYIAKGMMAGTYSGVSNMPLNIILTYWNRERLLTHNVVMHQFRLVSIIDNPLSSQISRL